jgi:hypothetical protein
LKLQKDIEKESVGAFIEPFVLYYGGQLFLSVAGFSDPVTCRIMNRSGMVVMETTISGDTVSFHPIRLESGVYRISFTCADHEFARNLIV